jgi:hypothetical protein
MADFKKLAMILPPNDRTALAQAATALKTYTPSVSTLSRLSAAECLICNDLGMVPTEAGWAHCKCWHRKRRARLLGVIPPKYRDAIIATMVPAHDGQTQGIESARNDPFSSFMFLGKQGTGKSHIFWSLYRNCIDSDRRATACTAKQLLEEYRAEMFAKPEERAPFVTVKAQDLRDATAPCSIFLDDIDKVKATEYVAEQLFDLIDAAYSYNHQLVVTSNLDLPDLTRHFEQADHRYGASIVRRLADDSNVIKMF